MEALNSHIYACALARVRSEFGADAWEAFQRVWDAGERPGAVAQAMQKDPAWVYQVKHKIVTRLREEIEHLTGDVAVFHRP